MPDGDVFVSGGLVGALGEALTETSSCERYNHLTGEWITMASLPVSIYRHTCILIPSGEIFIASGSDVRTACFLYDPVTEHVREAAPLPQEMSLFKLVPAYN